MAEPNETVSRTVQVPSPQIQEREVEPFQLARKRGIYILGTTSGGLEAAEMILDVSNWESYSVGNDDSIEFSQDCHFSNAEVHISSGRIPIWQKSEVSFFVMNSFETGELNKCELLANGEIEIENIAVNEVEIRQKVLLSVFDHFHKIQSSWSERGIVIGRCSSSSSDSHATEDKLSEDAAISHPKLMVTGFAEKTDVGCLLISYGSKTDSCIKSHPCRRHIGVC